MALKLDSYLRFGLPDRMMGLRGAKGSAQHGRDALVLGSRELQRGVNEHL